MKKSRTAGSRGLRWECGTRLQDCGHLGSSGVVKWIGCHCRDDSRLGSKWTFPGSRFRTNFLHCLLGYIYQTSLRAVSLLCYRYTPNRPLCYSAWGLLLWVEEGRVQNHKMERSRLVGLVSSECPHFGLLDTDGGVWCDVGNGGNELHSCVGSIIMKPTISIFPISIAKYLRVTTRESRGIPLSQAFVTKTLSVPLLLLVLHFAGL